MLGRACAEGSWLPIPGAPTLEPLGCGPAPPACPRPLPPLPPPPHPMPLPPLSRGPSVPLLPFSLLRILLGKAAPSPPPSHLVYRGIRLSDGRLDLRTSSQHQTQPAGRGGCVPQSRAASCPETQGRPEGRVWAGLAAQACQEGFSAPPPRPLRPAALHSYPIQAQGRPTCHSPTRTPRTRCHLVSQLEVTWTYLKAQVCTAER